MSEIKTNQISSLTGSNSDITLDPDGTGNLIVESGNVGIGTSSPNANRNLHLSDSTSGALRIEGTARGGYVEITDGTNTQYIGTPHSIAGSGNSTDLSFWTAGSDRGRWDSSGNLLVNTSTSRSGADSVSIEGPNSVIWFQADGTGVHSNMIFQRDTTGTPVIVGSIQTTGTATAFNTSSDYRLKENVADMTGAIDRVKALAPKRFNFIADADTTVDGFLAHEAQAVVPEAVTGTKDAMRDEEYEVTPAVLDDDGNVVTEAVMGIRSVPDYQGIDQSKLVPLLTGALREAIAKIETLETKVAALEAGE